MTICELINERNEVMRIDFWADGKVQVVQSHGYSTLYMLKYMQIKRAFPELTPDHVQFRTNIYIKCYHSAKVNKV